MTISASTEQLRELLPMVVNEAAMTISVGATTFDIPELRKWPENSLTIKHAICVGAGMDTEGDDLPSLHKFYCRVLGPKFNRRFHGANYWLWVGNRLSRSTANMMRMPGRHFRHYSNWLVKKANDSLPYIRETEADELHHLIPAIVTFGGSPSEIKKEIGGAAWKQIARNSRTRNTRIMQIAEHYGDHPKQAFIDLLGVPSGCLNGAKLFLNDANLAMAARLTPKRQAMPFLETAHLIRDARRMGVDINPQWGLARLRREHDEALIERRRGSFSNKTFADAWQHDSDGFHAERLTSQLDIALEGDAMHHCVASYSQLAADHLYLVLRIEGKERATAGYRLSRDDRTWMLDQCYGYCNDAVSSETYAFALEAGKAISHQKQQVAA